MEIKLKFSKLKFKANIKEVVKNLFDFNVGTVLTETLGVELTNEHKAFILLLRTIKKTNLELAKEYGQDELDKSKDLSIMGNELEDEIIKFLEKEVVINKEFFEDIINFNPTYLRQSFLFLRDFLNLLQIQYPDDLNFVYFNNFRKNLEEEFQEHKESYKSLIDFFDNPIVNENKKMLRQFDYYSDLIKQFIEPLQTDIPECKETLKDLYIEPNFEIHKNSLNTKGREDISEFNSSTSEISIHDFLKNYFLKSKKHPDFNESYNLLFILGQPGQGKTAFCYKLVYDFINEFDGLPDFPVFFIKIRSLVARDFIDSTFNEIKKAIKQDFNFQEGKCLLVLDGLDEAYMSGGLNDGDLKNLYERLKVATHNNKDLKIILTSRFNYLKLNDSCIDHSSVIQLSNFNSGQIKEYAEKFKVFYPQNKLVHKIDEIIENEEYEHIQELLQQAVLLYFIAISNIDIEEKDSRAVVYDKIFKSLAMRSWDKNGQLSYIKKDLKNNPLRYEKLLREYIRNIAFAIYQSPNLFITINQLLELEATAKFIKKCFDDSIEFSKEKIKEISKYLLISFYFQESKSNTTSETAIEFFHNSLWEYLTAEYMWEENKRILLEKDSDDDFQIITQEVYFTLLDRLIGQKELGEVTRQNLISIIENEKDEFKLNITRQSSTLFDKLLNEDFLLEFKKSENTLTSINKSFAIFELFWIFYFESNLVTKEVIEVGDRLSTYLFEYSKYSIGFDSIYKNLTFQGAFVSIPFSAENLYQNVIFNCGIDNSWFGYCKFIEVHFNDSIDFAIFTGNEFSNVIFKDCDINRFSHFENNTFINCKFRNASVKNKNWLKDLNKTNKVDEKIMQNHKIISTLKKNEYSGKSERKYIIKYIGEENINP